MKFDPRVTWAKFDPSRKHVFVYARLRSCHVLSMKIERKTQKAFLNEKFIERSLCLCLRKKRI